MTCFDRDKDSARLWAQFDKGRSVLMLAPRRIGKTVLLNRLRNESADRGYRAIVLDVQGFREEKDFFRQMCAAIQEELGFGASVLASLGERLRRTVRGSDETTDWRQLLLHTDWHEFARHLLSQLDQDKEGKPWLVLLDEIPIFALALLETHGHARVQDFLYALRQFRQAHRNVRWLFTGSIGLDSVARRHSVEGALNDLEAYPLKPFDAPTALNFLYYVAAANDRHLSPDAACYIADRLGWLSPYYLEKAAEEACQRLDRGQTIAIDAAACAVDALLDLDKRTYWSTWREHLDRNFADPERTHLFTVLAVIARAPEGRASRDTLLGELNRTASVSEAQLRGYLHTLEADGYLENGAAASLHYAFRMGLLRDWWLRYVAP
ncbi:MAG: AAA-like domain-containing protein [Rhodocyclaceae bacterium]|nr:AAA-like domain-containing protein [Rhodocyclaceae bacterium]